MTYSFTAHLSEDGALSKAVVNDNGTALWSAGDKIAVWDELGGEYKTFTNEGEGGATATFSFTGDPGVKYEFSRAIYPASFVKDTDSFDSAVTLPSEYSLEEASVASRFPMIATAEDNDLYFKHLGALVRLRINGAPSSAAQLVLSSSTVSLAGDFRIGKPQGIPSSGCENMTVVEGAVDTKSAPGTDYEIQATEGTRAVSIDIRGRNSDNLEVYVPFPLGVYSFTASLLDSAGQEIWRNATSRPKEILRANYYQMSSVSVLFSGGTGTAENPFQLASAADFSAFQTLLEADAAYRGLNYKLSADIDLAGISNFPPIGSYPDSPFTGMLDGDGHTIRNLTISSASHAALFAYLDGEVRNIKFEGASISATSGDAAAVIAAEMEGGCISRCSVDAESSVSASGNSAGSVAGVMRNGTINACASNACITAGTYCCGGITGFIQTRDASHNALIINCIYSSVYKNGHPYGATLQASNANAFMGGISGSASSKDGKGAIRIVNCFAYSLEMKVGQPAGASVQRVGGISGYAGTNGADDAIEIKNCVSPVTYSNVIVGGTRLDAKTYGSSPQTASIIGAIPHSGVVIDRLFSTNTWGKCYYLASGAALSSSNINAALGDTNLRGLGNATVGSTAYTSDIGGIAAALNAGAAQWNASSSIAAFGWVYEPTWGYPVPEGVAAPGVVTRKVSLMGDSISTYQGYMFSDASYTMNKWYPDSSNTYDGQILNEHETWWWKLIYDKMSDARLEASNSFSGATVSYLASRTEQQVTTNCFQRRAYIYGFGDPDILIYYGGRNDFGSFGSSSDINLGSYSEESLEAAWTGAPGVFFDNYAQGSVGILRDFHAIHPDAKVLVIMHDQMSDGYAQAAEAVVSFLARKGVGIRFVNLHKDGTKNATNTEIGVFKEGGTHPNSVGATNIANYVWSQVGAWLDK